MFAYEIEVTEWVDWRISPEEDFPMVVNMLKNRSKTDIKHGQIFESLVVPVDLDLFSL